MAAGTVWIANSSVASSAMANDLRYVPLRDAQTDSFAFQFVAYRAGTVSLTVNYVMSASEANNVRLRFDWIVLSAGDNPTTALTTGTAFTVTPGANVLMQQVTSTSSADLAITIATAGQVVCGKLYRLGTDGADSHTGDMRIIDVRAA